MRVLLATDSFPPECGGSGWSTWELARGLRLRAYEVFVVQPRPGRARGIRERLYDGFRVVEFGWPTPNVPYLRNYLKNERLTAALANWLEERVAEWQVDLIHAQHVLTTPASVKAARAQHVPVVCTVRDYWPVCYWSDLIVDRDARDLCPACSLTNMTRCVRPRAGGLWPLSLPMIPYMRLNLARKRRALSRADAIIAVSSTIADDLRARAPELATARVELIPNPLDVDDVAAAAQTRLRPDPYALYVGKIAPNKGTRFLIDVARQAPLHVPLVVVGDGPDRSWLEERSRELPAPMEILGWQSRHSVLRWMAHADFVIFPSFGPESLSRVLLEAGALGVPVAAMDTGGTRDIIEHERTGLLSATPQQLARDVARLQDDAGLRNRLGSQLRVHVRDTFSTSRVVDRIERLYRDLLKDSRAE
ncbi:MAG: glycosyltransferase family 4 protein [Vicinamibacterales bacterium]